MKKILGNISKVIFASVALVVIGVVVIVGIAAAGWLLGYKIFPMLVGL